MRKSIGVKAFSDNNWVFKPDFGHWNIFFPSHFLPSVYVPSNIQGSSILFQQKPLDHILFPLRIKWKFIHLNIGSEIFLYQPSTSAQTTHFLILPH